MRFTTQAVMVVFLIISLCCCSSGKSNLIDNSLMEENQESIFDSIPLINYDGNTAIGVFGGYNLTIAPDGSKAELTPMRTPTAVGDSYVLSGTPFFTTTNSFRIKSVAFDRHGGIAIEFEIKHPFPSTMNRKDLDLFDIALVVVPPGRTPKTYALGTAYSDVLLNSDGYTNELSSVLGDTTLMPYKICYESSTNNRFKMGTGWQTFKVLFTLSNTGFELYLTMGYGVSANKSNRMNPTYYIPEFNRKAAWKVMTSPPTFEENYDITKELLIDIYDWNHGATVATPYPNPAHLNWISESSDITSVQVDIPDLMNDTVDASSSDTTHNGWDDPITYRVILRNDKDATRGHYIGLIKVADSRQPNINPPGGRDYLIHTPDGIQMENYTIPEFATYQSFIVTVEGAAPDYSWGEDWGSDQTDEGCQFEVDSEKNTYIVGYFQKTVDFDPDPLKVVSATSKGAGDVFLCKFDIDGNLKWVKTFGSSIWDEGYALAIDHNNNVFITGYFQGSNTDLDPSPTKFKYKTSNGGADAFLSKFDSNGNLIEAVTWGGTEENIWDEGHGLAVDNSNNVFVMGHFGGNVDFNPTHTPPHPHTSYGDKDVFISKFDNNLNFTFAETFGGGIWDEGTALICDSNDNIYGAGYFCGTVDFDPSPGGTFNGHSNGESDIFLTKLANNGVFNWAITLGSSIWDEGHGLAASSSNDIFLTGYYRGTVDFNPGSGTDNHTSNAGSPDIFVSSFTSSGGYNWTRAWGGTGEDCGKSIFLDDYELLVTGFFENTVDFDFVWGGDLHTSNGGKDVFLTCMSSWGSPRWSITWGGSGKDEGRDTGTGSYLVLGNYSKTADFDPEEEEDWHTALGQTDVFFVKFDWKCDYNEIEPNDDCVFDEGEDINPSVMYCGSVTKGTDEEDYFLIFAYWGAYIYLYNNSTQNIDLYLYNSDCSTLIDQSTKSGTDNEYVYDDGTGYRVIKVKNEASNYEPLDYKLIYYVGEPW